MVQKAGKIEVYSAIKPMNGGSKNWENRKSMAHDSHDRTNGRFIEVYSWEIPEIPELNGGL